MHRYTIYVNLANNSTCLECISCIVFTSLCINKVLRNRWLPEDHWTLIYLQFLPSIVARSLFIHSPDKMIIELQKVHPPISRWKLLHRSVGGRPIPFHCSRIRFHEEHHTIDIPLPLTTILNQYSILLFVSSFLRFSFVCYFAQSRLTLVSDTAEYFYNSRWIPFFKFVLFFYHPLWQDTQTRKR